MGYVRKCEKWGTIDSRQRWSSPSESASQDAFSNWTCVSCAWTEFDLVEEETEVEAQAQATR